MVTTVTVSFVQHSAAPSAASEHFGKVQTHETDSALLLGGAPLDPSFRPGFRGREGYTGGAAAATPRSKKMYIPNTTWTWSFAIVTFCQTLVVLALEMYGTLSYGKTPCSLYHYPGTVSN